MTCSFVIKVWICCGGHSVLENCEFEWSPWPHASSSCPTELGPAPCSGCCDLSLVVAASLRFSSATILRWRPRGGCTKPEQYCDQGARFRPVGQESLLQDECGVGLLSTLTRYLPGFPLLPICDLSGFCTSAVKSIKNFHDTIFLITCV